MSSSHVSTLARELETTLRLLGELVDELRGREADLKGGRVQEILSELGRRPSLAELPTVMLRVYSEISAALGGIRQTREAIQAHAVQRLHDSHDKLKEVSSTTESATMEMMNGLDRTLALIDDLERQADSASPAPAFNTLRGEVNQMFNHLQFQDITAQQLQGVTHLLIDVESRIDSVAAMFGQAIGEAAPASSESLSYNPDATVKNTAARQAMIDEAFQQRTANCHADGVAS